jgi:hypothetical protein
MMALKLIAVILHILTAAAFFGLGLILPRQARIFAQTQAAVLGEQGERTARMMTMFGVLTLVFSLIAFFTPPGGFAVYGPEFHTSLLLIVILLGVHLGLVHRGWSDLRVAVAGGADGRKAVKQIAMGIGIAHLLWLVILVLMFWSAPLWAPLRQLF